VQSTVFTMTGVVEAEAVSARAGPAQLVISLAWS